MLFVLILAFPIGPSFNSDFKKTQKNGSSTAWFYEVFSTENKKQQFIAGSSTHLDSCPFGRETFSAVELVKTLKKSIPHRKIFFSVSTATGFR
jgi:hypothetical protein